MKMFWKFISTYHLHIFALLAHWISGPFWATEPQPLEPNASEHSVGLWYLWCGVLMAYRDHDRARLCQDLTEQDFSCSSHVILKAEVLKYVEMIVINLEDPVEILQLSIGQVSRLRRRKCGYRWLCLPRQLFHVSFIFFRFFHKFSYSEIRSLQVLPRRTIWQVPHLNCIHVISVYRQMYQLRASRRLGCCQPVSWSLRAQTIL